MASSYDQNFPPLEPASNSEKTRFSRPYVQTSEVLPDGSLKHPSHAEQVLNWQSHNARIQNRVLNSIDQKIDRVSHHVSQHENRLHNTDSTFRDMFSDLQSQIAKLDADLHYYIHLGYHGSKFDKKEKEIRQLKAQLEQLQKYQAYSRQPPYKPRVSHSHSMGFSSFPPPPSPAHSPDYSHYFKSTGELFQKYPFPAAAAKSKSRSSSKASGSHRDKGPASFSAPYKPALYISPRSSPSTIVDSDSVSVSSSMTHSSTGSPFHLSPSPELPDPTQLFMASRAEPSARTYESPGESSTGPTPIVEEPPDAPPTQLSQVPKSRPTNGPWFQLDDSSPDSWRKKISEMSAWLDLQMAKSEQTLEAILREFVSHFTGSFRDWYQALGEYKQLQSIRSQSISHAMGIIFREFLGDPDQFYKQARQEFFDLRCCSLKKKDVEYHYKRMSGRYHILGGINDQSLKHVYVNSLPTELQEELQRRIDTSGRSFNDITLGGIHMFTLGALHKLCATQKIFSKMLREGKRYLKDIADEVHSDADVESIFSEQETVDQNTTFVLQYSDSSDTDSADYGSSSYQTVSTDSASGPQVPIQILLTKFSIPIDVIAYVDTGSHTTMMNPNILLPDNWKPHTRYFKAADDNIFTTNLISKSKIGLKFFPSFTNWTQVLDTSLPDKDILIGWDVYCQCTSLRILPSGGRYKRDFNPFSLLHKIFPLSELQPPFQNIQQKLLQFCTNSHAEFTHPSPLWKNPDFFVHLPFKLNEDANPTKATHSGMSPSDLQLATAECNELLSHDVIEPTSSQWACQAFYVEKRSKH
ncbi:hypothetical protein Dsin_030504 [Dipteronia sinensis]|uniref:Uncharacterized protein n=1 Tax=Dipteronia sinensis TaxID=43782 RepID=A0AAD9ZJC2_9ROSI|nr:hypothetical protein Dsin_030504 [Dipteronia sinensis]